MKGINRIRHLRTSFLLLAGLVALSCCLIQRPLLAAGDEPATATQNDKKQAADADSKKDKADGSAAKSGDEKHTKNGKTDQKEQPSAEKTKSDADKAASESNAKAKESEKPKTSADSSAKKDNEKEKAKQAKVRLAMLTLKDSLPETAGQAGPFSDIRLDLRELVGRLEKAAKDKSISGIVLDIQNPEIGRGKVEELRGAISRFRASGKKAYAMLDSAEPSDYLVACACDEIVMPETGIVVLPGVHAEAMFFKGLLAKLGIEADFIHMGDYKGAAEPLTREKFSEPVRENMTSLVDDLYDDMITTIVKDRPLSIGQTKAVIDTGIITAARAKELGLIDRIAYRDTLRDELAKKYHAEPLVFVKNYGKKEVDTDFSGPMGFFKLVQAMMGGESSSGERKGKKIAVVYAVGPITTGKSQGGMFGEVMGSTTIVEALRKANDDKNVVAIVLRVDSPGGSALASDLIWHETQVIKKPIVASMGDVAASGGYYISMGCDKIYAEPFAVQPGIGVVGGKIVDSSMKVVDGPIVVGTQNLCDVAHKGLSSEVPGNVFRNEVISNFSAVSISCMAFRRNVALEVGGFDAENLPNSLFDIELCLRVREKGYRIVHDPFVVMLRPAAAERRTPPEAETEYFRKRWKHYFRNDPFYNPNFSYKDGTFTIKV